MSKLARASLGTVFALFGVVLALVTLVWFTTHQPAEVEAAPVACGADAPKLQPGQPLKVLSWNVQFMAGKNYVFWFDVPNSDGPDERPSPADITFTIEEVARIIRDENPDVIQLQEVDRGARRTDYEDQLARLLTLLPGDYVCSATAYYWKAAFVPHPRVMGAMGLSLATISRFQIVAAQRHQLAIIPKDWISQQFSPKRAILETRLPTVDGRQFVALNTHFDAFAQGTDTMQLQVTQAARLLASLDAKGLSWIFGGDLNLLPPSDAAYNRLPPALQTYYLPKTPAQPLFDHFQAFPTQADTAGPDAARWFTHYGNDPQITAPDRTIDFLFLPKAARAPLAFTVRSTDTRRTSDHFPLVAVVEVK